jgi:hypothetical protein
VCNAEVRWLRDGLVSTRDADLDEVMADLSAFGKAEAAAAHGLTIHVPASDYMSRDITGSCCQSKLRIDAV